MDPIIPFDLGRMLWGEAPPFFLAEILLRIAVIWPWTQFLLRWIGGRSISQLSLAEFLLVIALGSAVGDSLFQPDVPLLHAMLVILVVVLIDKLIDITIRQSAKAKQIFDGTPVEVLRHGKLLGQGLKINKISSVEVMEMLRLRGVANLGALESAYIEPSGQISAFAADPPRIGLPIVPPTELVEKYQSSPLQAGLACCTCGEVFAAPVESCGACGDTQAIPAEAAKPWKSA